MPMVPVADGMLNVRLEGSGPPILLVHGFPLDHSMWDAQVEALRSNYSLIVPDLRGFGLSGVTEGTVTMAQFADDLASLLTELGIISPVCLCGLSMGGYIAFEMLRRHPSRVKSAILCDTRAVADSAEAIQKRLETASTVEREGTKSLVDAMPDRMYSDHTKTNQPELIEQTREVMRRAPPAGVAAASRGMAQRADASVWLSEITVPTLVICGESDVISPPEEMRQIAAQLPSARFVSIPLAAHLSPQEQPEAFNAAVAQFLQNGIKN